jgi:hypothetical protein
MILLEEFFLPYFLRDDTILLDRMLSFKRQGPVCFMKKDEGLDDFYRVVRIVDERENEK